MASRLASVSMIEGSTALTQMRSAMSSSARPRVRFTTAALLAAYADDPALGMTPNLEATLTIRPPGLPVTLRIFLTASRQQRKLVTALVSIILRKSASDVFVIGA